MATAFQLWKDYFQLAKVIEEIGWKRHEGGLEAAFLPKQQKLDQIQVQPSLQESGEEAPMCTFCKHNGESKRVYGSHQLKDNAGRVQCPILRNYTCPQCGASKDTAHTKRYCPLTKKGYTSVYRSCIRNSAGKKSKASTSEHTHGGQGCPPCGGAGVLKCRLI
uniref:Nanos C2HC-type zinc finger 3 n=1 Tax=Salvator merianae TaxID=96440 RepID=A0A8D0DTP0_SALMN